MEVSTASDFQPEQQDDSCSIAFYVYIVLGVLGMVGNAFVCVVMLRFRSIFNSTTNKLIIHQSIVDFLGSFVFILGRILLITPPAKVPDNTLGSLYCKLWWSEWPQYGVLITSSYNLAAISMERYLATCKPIRHRNMFSSNRQLKLIIVAVWICGWLPEFHLPPVAYQAAGTCDALWPSLSVQALTGILLFIAEFSLPLAMILFAYTKIILELYRRSKTRVGDTNQDGRNMLSKANKNVTKTLLVVAVSYVICWTPTEIDYLLYNLQLNNNFVDASIWRGIVLLNVCINPFIYCFTYDRFQKQLKTMMCGGCQRNFNRVDTTSGSTRQATNSQHTAQVSVISATNNPAEP